MPPLSILIRGDKGPDGLDGIVGYGRIGRKNEPDPHSDGRIGIENGRTEKAKRHEPKKRALAKKEEAKNFVSLVADNGRPDCGFTPRLHLFYLTHPRLNIIVFTELRRVFPRLFILIAPGTVVLIRLKIGQENGSDDNCSS